jgi:hypothetical protein
MDKISYFTKKASCCCGNLHIRLGCNNRRVCEVYFDLRNSDPCKRSCAEAAGRIITLILQNEFSPAGIINRADIGAIINVLEETGCPDVMYAGKKAALSCAQAAAEVLKAHQ